MIVKFDHISYIAKRQHKNKIIEKNGVPAFCEKMLTNLTIKKDLMRHPQDTHDLYFYHGEMPVEYILYDEVDRHSNIIVHGNKIYGKYTALDNAKAYLEGIFGKRIIETDGTLMCNMKGIIDKKDYCLILKYTEDADIVPFLDDGGYGVVALIVKNDFQTPTDGICTQREHLKVNNKDLEICFIRSNSTNIIFELIWI